MMDTRPTKRTCLLNRPRVICILTIVILLLVIVFLAYPYFLCAHATGPYLDCVRKIQAQAWF